MISPELPAKSNSFVPGSRPSTTSNEGCLFDDAQPVTVMKNVNSVPTWPVIGPSWGSMSTSSTVLMRTALRAGAEGQEARAVAYARGLLRVCEVLLARGLDPSELVRLSQVSWVKTVPASAGRNQACDLARRSLDGLRRSLAVTPRPGRAIRSPARELPGNAPQPRLNPSRVTSFDVCLRDWKTTCADAHASAFVRQYPLARSASTWDGGRAEVNADGPILLMSS